MSEVLEALDRRFNSSGPCKSWSAGELDVASVPAAIPAPAGFKAPYLYVRDTPKRKQPLKAKAVKPKGKGGRKARVLRDPETCNHMDAKGLAWRFDGKVRGTIQRYRCAACRDRGFMRGGVIVRCIAEMAGKRHQNGKPE